MKCRECGEKMDRIGRGGGDREFYVCDNGHSGVVEFTGEGPGTEKYHGAVRPTDDTGA